MATPDGDLRRIFCDARQAEALAFAKPNGDRLVRCPSCGTEDRLEDATRQAVAYALHQQIKAAIGNGPFIQSKGHVDRPRFIFEGLGRD